MEALLSGIFRAPYVCSVMKFHNDLGAAYLTPELWTFKESFNADCLPSAWNHHFHFQRLLK